jgi:hypothetical protein
MKIEASKCPESIGSCGVGAGHDILAFCDSRLVYPVGSDKICEYQALERTSTLLVFQGLIR